MPSSSHPPSSTSDRPPPWADDERARPFEDSGTRDALPRSAALVFEEGALLAQKYRLTRPAGFGGMAQLWVAVNEATGADVCVKVLVPEKSDDESVERFRREAYAAARLSHRAIVRIFDLVELGPDGETSDGVKPAALAIVMELLHGETLAELLMKRDALGVEEMIDLALPLLSALAHAHRAGVVHRDLKPDNVFLSTDPDGHVIPKVLDFGVSKLASAEGDVRRRKSAAPVTLDGVMLGTPSFMSPEQARGSRDVDARSDVFSAGILMYLMLSGKNPFESEHFHSVVSAIIHLDPPRIATAPEAIWEVIARALAKDAELRYRDATELGIALRRASGRTSTTESGPQPGLGISVPPGLANRDSAARVLVVPLGGDSIVTVPPASHVESSSVRPAATPRRRTATSVVLGVVAASAVLLLVAALRTSPRSSSAPLAASSPPPSSTATSEPVPAVAPEPVPSPAAEPSVVPPPVRVTAVDGGVAKKPDPRTARPAKKNDARRVKEPSIVRDPGF